MVFGQLCSPALIYIVFSITQITMDSLKGLYNMAMVKIFVSILFTILLNHLCERGLGIISWIIVFIPFMLMSLIVALLLTTFGLNPTTGKLNLEPKKKKELDAREKAILNYSMAKPEEKTERKKGWLEYLGLSGGQNTINPGETAKNPAHNNLYDTTGSTSSYQLVKSGTNRNKLRSRIIAEELYNLLQTKVSADIIQLDVDVGGAAKRIFINNCDVAIKAYYEDIYYRFNKIYGVFDLEESKQEEKIKSSLAEIKTWGVLRNTEGKVIALSDFDVNNFRKYTGKLVDTDPNWIEKILVKYRTRKDSKYESTCGIIQRKLNQFATTNNVDFDNVFSNSGDSSYTDALEDAYKSDMFSDDFIAPTTCTAEMKTICKIKTKGECKPCKSSDVIPGSGTTNEAKVACPYLCDTSDLMVQFSNSADVDKAKLRKSKLCNYCNLCTGPADPITNLPAPKGHAWKSMSELVASGLTSSDFKKGTGGAIGGDQVPKKFEAEGSLKGLGDRSWWTMLYPNSSGPNQDGSPNANHVNIRNCVNLYSGTNANEERWKAAGGDTCVSKTTQQTCDSVNVCKWNYGSSKCEDKGGGSFNTQKILDQHITFSSIEGDPGDWKSAVTERDLSERGLKLGNVQKTKSTWKQYITDQSISAQKVYDLPRSRLDVVPNQHSAADNINGYGSAGWFPKTGQTDNWMILDLGDVFKVNSLSTRPGQRLVIDGDTTKIIEGSIGTFEIKYSDKNETTKTSSNWKQVINNNGTKTFNSSNNARSGSASSLIEHVFNAPVLAKSIMITNIVKPDNKVIGFKVGLKSTGAATADYVTNVQQNPVYEFPLKLANLQVSSQSSNNPKEKGIWGSTGSTAWCSDKSNWLGDKSGSESYIQLNLTEPKELHYLILGNNNASGNPGSIKRLEIHLSNNSNFPASETVKLQAEGWPKCLTSGNVIATDPDNGNAQFNTKETCDAKGHSWTNAYITPYTEYDTQTPPVEKEKSSIPTSFYKDPFSVSTNKKEIQLNKLTGDNSHPRYQYVRVYPIDWEGKTNTAASSKPCMRIGIKVKDI